MHLFKSIFNHVNYFLNQKYHDCLFKNSNKKRAEGKHNKTFSLKFYLKVNINGKKYFNKNKFNNQLFKSLVINNTLVTNTLVTTL